MRMKYVCRGHALGIAFGIMMLSVILLANSASAFGEAKDDNGKEYICIVGQPGPNYNICVDTGTDYTANPNGLDLNNEGKTFPGAAQLVADSAADSLASAGALLIDPILASALATKSAAESAAAPIVATLGGSNCLDLTCKGSDLITNFLDNPLTLQVPNLGFIGWSKPDPFLIGSAGPDNSYAEIKCATGKLVRLAIMWDGDIHADLGPVDSLLIAPLVNSQNTNAGLMSNPALVVEIPLRDRVKFPNLGELRGGQTLNICGRHVTDTNPLELWNELHPVTSLTIIQDTTPPIITPTIAGTAGNNGWYKSDATVSWDVTDTESGIAFSSGCGPTTLSGDTAGTDLTCSATNGAELSNSNSATVKIDKTPPGITASAIADGSSYMSGTWTNKDVTVSFSCSDALSGIASCSSPQTITIEGTGQTASGTGIDQAGNSASTTFSGINIDKTAPVTTDDSPSAWQKTDFTVTLTCTDTGGSGCKETKYSIDGGTLQVGNSIIISTEGDHLIEYYSVDGAGNQESTKSIRARLDKTLPIISFSSIGTFNLASAASVVVAVTDSVSGVAYQSVPSGANTLDTSSVGARAFTVTARDNAGNEATSTYTYNVIYDFLGAGGFQSPISNTATNTGKAGSVVPVKWQLPDGSGGFISDLKVVLPFTYRLGSCSSSTSEFPADTSGNTGLRYDTTTNQYIYNWKTPNTAGCYVLVLKLNDGSEYTANFALR